MCLAVPLKPTRTGPNRRARRGAVSPAPAGPAVPFELPGREPDYPLDYVLDGQQRITSIFGVFQPAGRRGRVSPCRQGLQGAS